MRKKIDLNKIEEVSTFIHNKCEELSLKSEELKKVVLSLKEINSTTNCDMIIEKYLNEINDLNETIDVLKFYASFMNDSYNQYADVYSRYNNKLNAFISEIGDNYEIGI